MCLAIFKPSGGMVSEDRLTAGWQKNPGGAGFCYVKKGKVVIEKGFMKLQDFMAAYDTALKKNKKSAFLIHFRIPSMGDRSESNTHPFSFAHGALIHNGTIHGTGAQNSVGQSDSAFFTLRYGDELTFDNVEKNKKAIDEALGYNKIAILYNNGTHQILNESDGVWVGGAWYSNRHSLPACDRQIGGY